MSIRPKSQPEEVVLDFEVDVTDEFIDDHINTLGTLPAKRWSISFSLEQVPPSLRASLRDAYNRYLETEPYPVVSAPTDDPGEFLALLLPWLETVEGREAEESKAHELEQRKAERAQQMFVREMKLWAEQNGSPRLQAALTRGYKANTTYAIERASKEVPGFWVDTAGDAEWNERSDPSAEALALEETVQRHLDKSNGDLRARIVWLTEAPRSLNRWLEERGDYFEAQEALLVVGYLVRYSILLPVDDELHRPVEEEV